MNIEDEQYEKLVTCFGQAFPNLKRADIPTATHKTVSDWDSIGYVTLLSLVGEAFNIDVDFDEFEGADSFEAILQLVKAKTGA